MAAILNAAFRDIAAPDDLRTDAEIERDMAERVAELKRHPVAKHVFNEALWLKVAAMREAEQAQKSVLAREISQPSLSTVLGN